MEMWECVVLTIMCVGMFFCLSPFVVFALAQWWGAMKEAFEEFKK